MDQDDALCDCDTQVGKITPHTCPYREDIYDDRETLCRCCPYCRAQCAEDI